MSSWLATNNILGPEKLGNKLNSSDNIESIAA